MPDSVALCLLGGFSLRIDGDEVSLPMHARRVLAYLSLDQSRERDCDRWLLAERLWPDAGSERSRASLRTALWRIRRVGPDLVHGASRVRLADSVDVDVRSVRRDAEAILSWPSLPVTQAGRPVECPRLVARDAELLPGWDETWLTLAREQLRQLRLHALEATARMLTDQGRHAESIDVMLGVVAAEPLRESSRKTLIEAHLQEGNVAEARAQFDEFAELLWTELRVRPSPEIRRSVGRADALVSPGPH